MRQYELIDSVTSYKPDADQKLLEKAYIYGTKMHGRQLRASGDPYFSHPIEVAGILAELKLDTTTVVCALLHNRRFSGQAGMPSDNRHCRISHRWVLCTGIRPAG